MDYEKVKELKEIKKTIIERSNEKLQDGIESITNTISMLGDLQEMCSVLFETISEQKNVIDSLSKDNKQLLLEIDERNNTIKQMEKKVSEVEKLSLNSVKVAAILSDVQVKEQELREGTEALEREKTRFEEEKGNLLEQLHLKERLSEERRKERDKACRDRDEAISNRNEIERKVSEYKQELDNSIEKIEELDELKNWYMRYSISLDKKVIDKYTRSSNLLDDHYYNYLINPEKTEEHRKHFPQYELISESESSDTNAKEENEIIKKQIVETVPQIKKKKKPVI